MRVRDPWPGTLNSKGDLSYSIDSDFIKIEGKDRHAIARDGVKVLVI